MGTPLPPFAVEDGDLVKSLREYREPLAAEVYKTDGYHAEHPSDCAHATAARFRGALQLLDRILTASQELFP